MLHVSRLNAKIHYASFSVATSSN